MLWALGDADVAAFVLCSGAATARYCGKSGRGREWLFVMRIDNPLTLSLLLTFLHVTRGSHVR